MNTEKAMAPHSSTLAWQIPWTEEPGRLQSMGSLGVGHDWVASLSLFTFMHWRREWQPTPVFLPGKSQGRGNLVGCRLWGRRVGQDLAAAAYNVRTIVITSFNFLIFKFVRKLRSRRKHLKYSIEIIDKCFPVIKKWKWTLCCWRSCSVAQSCLWDPMNFSLSSTMSLNLFKLTSIESMMPSNHLILCGPLLFLPSIFPIIRVFSNEWALRIQWPEYWS